MSTSLRNIIDLAVCAPSGDNCQPWRFEIIGKSTLHLFNLPERDNSLYGSKQRPSFIAHGALLENIAIASTHFGLTTSINLFPESRVPNFVASINFLESAVQENPLFSFLERRATNRKAYLRERLTDEQRRLLTLPPAELEGVNVFFIENETEKKKLATIAAMNEAILFENELLHRFFFNHVIWKEDEETKRPGFHVKTFELKPGQDRLFKLFGNWETMRLLARLKIPWLVVKQNASIYNSSSAIVVLSIKKEDDTPVSYVKMGRLFQRLWLQAESGGLSLQPLTGLTLLYFLVKDGVVDDKLENRHKDLIIAKYDEIKKICQIPESHLVPIMFRIGQAGPPSYRTKRMPPEVLLR